MLDSIISVVKCEACGDSLYYSVKDTFDDYSSSQTFDIEHIENIVDGIISEYMVLKCVKCGALYKYTFKDIERLARKEISRMVMTSIAIGEIVQSNKLKSSDRTLIYCNKCNGTDGKGGCLLSVYRDCKLKRLPYGL